MTRSEVLVEAGRLAADGKPYALATVVRVVRPASTRRGDRALVTPHGTLAGWVGGARAGGGPPPGPAGPGGGGGGRPRGGGRARGPLPLRGGGRGLDRAGAA